MRSQYALVHTQGILQDFNPFHKDVSKAYLRERLRFCRRYIDHYILSAELARPRYLGGVPRKKREKRRRQEDEDLIGCVAFIHGNAKSMDLSAYLGNHTLAGYLYHRFRSFRDDNPHLASRQKEAVSYLTTQRDLRSGREARIGQIVFLGFSRVRAFNS